jgi:hypothetical protein
MMRQIKYIEPVFKMRRATICDVIDRTNVRCYAFYHLHKIALREIHELGVLSDTDLSRFQFIFDRPRFTYVVEIVTNQCKVLLLGSKNNNGSENCNLRLIEVRGLNFALRYQGEILCDVHLDHDHVIGIG